MFVLFGLRINGYTCMLLLGNAIANLQASPDRAPTLSGFFLTVHYR